MRYEELTPLLLHELQQQRQQLQAFSQQLAELKAQNDSLRAAVERLRGQQTKTVATLTAPGEQ